MKHGTSEHAESITEGRHPGVRDGLQWLTYAHLPESLQSYSEVFYASAVALIDRIPTDSPELTTAINHLIAAKDSAVRAGIRHATGRAGSVSRPQEVVSPPRLGFAETCSHGVRRDKSPQAWASAHVSGYCGDPE